MNSHPMTTAPASGEGRQPHTSHDWKGESNGDGWHTDYGCCQCGISVGQKGTYEPCPASVKPDPARISVERLAAEIVVAQNGGGDVAARVADLVEMYTEDPASWRGEIRGGARALSLLQPAGEVPETACICGEPGFAPCPKHAEVFHLPPCPSVERLAAELWHAYRPDAMTWISVEETYRKIVGHAEHWADMLNIARRALGLLRPNSGVVPRPSREDPKGAHTWHLSCSPGLVYCGANTPNMQSTEVLDNANCVECLRWAVQVRVRVQEAANIELLRQLDGLQEDLAEANAAISRTTRTLADLPVLLMIKGAAERWCLWLREKHRLEDFPAALQDAEWTSKMKQVKAELLRTSLILADAVEALSGGKAEGGEASR